MLNNKIKILVVANLLLLPTAALAEFKDVGTFHTYQDSINKLATQGCITGYADKTFKPDNAINRAETLKLLMQCIDLPNLYAEEILKVPAGASYIVNGQETKVDKDTEVKIKVPFDPATYPALEFRDIQNTEWFVPTLKEALVRKLITGYADNTIKATRTVSKAEFFAMLYRLVPKDLQKVDLSKDIAKDSLIGQWFSEGLGFAIQNNLIGLDSAGNINPNKELTRAQVAHFIQLYKNWLNNKLNPTVSAVTTPTAQTPTPPAAPVVTPPTTTPSFSVGYTEEGQASFMGTAIQGSKTASGSLYDSAGYTAAHKTLPFGTIVKVTNTANGQWVKVSINDRGPYTEGRILDLSDAAFSAIEELSKGVAKVKLEVELLP